MPARQRVRWFERALCFVGGVLYDESKDVGAELRHTRRDKAVARSSGGDEGSVEDRLATSLAARQALEALG